MRGMTNVALREELRVKMTNDECRITNVELRMKNQCCLVKELGC